MANLTHYLSKLILLNSIFAEVAQELINKPPIFYSSNLDGGDELNQKIFNEYKDVIHYKY